MAGSDGPDNAGKSSDLLIRILIGLLVLVSGGNGIYTISSTDDRIRRAEVESALESRDKDIQHLREQYRELKEQVDRIDQNGPAVGNRGFERRISKLEDLTEEMRK